MVDRARREHEPLGDLPVLETLGDERQHLELARGQTRGFAARRLARTAQPEPPAEVLREPAGAEALQLLERRLVIRVGERPRRLVGAQPRAPRRGSAGGVAVELEPVRLGDPVRRLLERARLPLPVRELAGEPEMALLEREVVGRARLLDVALARRRRATPPPPARRGRGRAAGGGRPDGRSRGRRRARPTPPGRRAWREGDRARSGRSRV